jgi:hypothetical protein
MTKPLQLFTKLKDAWAYVGGLSDPEKMPGYSYGLPASECNVGSKLRKVEGTICSKCYAHKGMYGFANVQEAQKKRMETLYKPYWVPAMTFLLKLKQYNARIKDCSVFRWHDSGDIQDMRHFLNICSVAKQTPTIQHWIPTREVGLIRQFLKQGHKIPDNMVVRISAVMIGQAPAMRHPLLKDTPGIAFSAVDYEDATQCMAYKNDGHCGTCRECWDPKTKVVSYPKH